MSCSAYTAGRRRRKWGGTLGWWFLSSQATPLSDRALLSWRDLNICLLMGSRERHPCFALLARVSFAYLKCFYLDLWVFSFYPCGSLPHPAVEEWMRRCVVLSCHLELNNELVLLFLFKCDCQNEKILPWLFSTLQNVMYKWPHFVLKINCSDNYLLVPPNQILLHLSDLASTQHICYSLPGLFFFWPFRPSCALFCLS